MATIISNFHRSLTVEHNFSGAPPADKFSGWAGLQRCLLVGVALVEALCVDLEEVWRPQ